MRNELDKDDLYYGNHLNLNENIKNIKNNVVTKVEAIDNETMLLKALCELVLCNQNDIKELKEIVSKLSVDIQKSKFTKD